MATPTETLQIVFTEKEKAELRTIPLKPPGNGEVLVRTTSTLISTGTETICYGRRFDPGTHWDNWVKYPFPTGYSHVGVVESVGPGVTRFKAGDRVCSAASHQQYVVISADGLMPIPDGVSDRDAAGVIRTRAQLTEAQRSGDRNGDSTVDL